MERMSYGQLRQMFIRRYRLICNNRHRWALQRRNDQQIILVQEQLKELKTLIKDNHDH